MSPLHLIPDVLIKNNLFDLVINTCHKTQLSDLVVKSNDLILICDTLPFPNTYQNKI